jgi:hypothetical protein
MANTRMTTDPREELEQLLTDAEDCELISKLAIEVATRERFGRVSAHLRGLATNFERLIAAQTMLNESSLRPRAPRASAS